MTAKVYTRGGDRGSTSLLSGGRVPKDDLRVEAYGALDELQAHLGVARSLMKGDTFADVIYEVQEDISTAGAELSCAGKLDNLKVRLTTNDVEKIEQWIDNYTAIYKLPQRFVVPGESRSSAAVHVARTVCRRSERLIVGLDREVGGLDTLLQYFNRLSDLLFTIAWGLEVETVIADTVLQTLVKEGE
ncbi:cob(I)yrinic acid a,c-diamide adenosyltransferase [Desulfogranum marinum]|uniref:cob(I)yrinic acid a,c-diamide adenosyltransferase n=1 Tax=Desulfogranum marinum TaxID=453220 RepID=UPI001965B10E|nr:cob(I)yrinic acid a,c-diamide adenosyltransferase [Desulfogranum marinum]MBM9512618.1 cob(I)yrinic acid a,c-diamide adenosyltransferase [Desulfogranum marinum]